MKKVLAFAIVLAHYSLNPLFLKPTATKLPKLPFVSQFSLNFLKLASFKFCFLGKLSKALAFHDDEHLLRVQNIMTSVMTSFFLPE